MLTKNVNNFKSGDRSILKGMSVFVFSLSNNIILQNWAKCQ